MQPTHPTPARFAEQIRLSLPWSTGRTRLRPLTEDDLDAFLGYRGRPDVSMHLSHSTLDRDAARDLLQRWLADPDRLCIAIEHRGVMIGDITVRVRACFAKAPAQTDAVESGLAYALHPDHQGTGLATEAVGTVVNRLFAAGLRKMSTEVFHPATASSALLHRLGFRQDGLNRAVVLSPDGTTWWDDQLWSRLATDPAPG